MSLPKILGAFVLIAIAWVFFLATAVLAWLAVPAALAFGSDYGHALARALDRTAAAVFGWGDGATVSAHCGSDHKGCAFCRLVCGAINLRWPGHCANAALVEGLAASAPASNNSR